MPSQFTNQSQFGQPVPLQLLSQFNPPQRGVGVGYQQPTQIDAAMLERLRRQQQFEQQQQERLLLLGQLFRGQ